MRTVRFDYRTDRTPTGYYCSEAGDQSGEYVPAETVRDLFAELDGDIPETVGKLKIDKERGGVVVGRQFIPQSDLVAALAVLRGS